MKKLIVPLLILAIGFLVTLIVSCKKDNGNEPVSINDYRLVSEKLIGPNDSIFTSIIFDYTADQLTEKKMIDNNYRFIQDYLYQTDKVVSNVEIFEGSTLENEYVIDYLFKNDRLIGIVNKKKVLNDTILKIEFSYTGDKLTEYIEFHYSYLEKIFKPYSKGEYQYQNDDLVRYSYFGFTNGDWELEHSKELFYENSKLKEQYVTLKSNFDPQKTKLTYSYDGSQLIRTDVYYFYDVSWIQNYFVDHIYDGNGNLFKDEFRNINDSSINHYKEYQYEPGKSNMEEIYFGTYPFDDQNILMYPVPTSFKSVGKEF